MDQKVDVISTNDVLDKQEFKEVEEKDTNGEITRYYTLAQAASKSEMSFVLEDEVSYSPLK